MKPLFLSSIVLLLLCCCYGNKKQIDSAIDLSDMIEKGEITAVTLNSSTSYFQFKMQPMGYEYELVADFAKKNGLKLHIKVAENETRLLEMLFSGQADVVAYPIKIDNNTIQDVLSCGHERQTSLVIIQRANQGDTIISDVTQLIGKDVYVNADTRYQQRLENLNSELGGGIRILKIGDETTSTEDLIEMVSTGVIPYTVCEENMARLNRTYFRNIDVNLAISFKQRYTWVVRKTSPHLAKVINDWASNKESTNTYSAITKRYFERSKNMIPFLTDMVPVTGGKISPYDHLFIKYALKLDWDWQLLASIAYQESDLNPSAIAWSGAEGLMGVMPATAGHFGFQPGEMQDPEKCIIAGVECLYQFRKGFLEIPDSLEQIKLTLASYNAGIGHINDARQLAEKYGKDPNVWKDNVADYLRLKSDPQYYTDPVCKFGYLRGIETFNYVDEVMERYSYYMKATE